MRFRNSVAFILAFILAFCCAGAAFGETPEDKADARISIKVLILPKFEIGQLSGDYPGEAQYYYEGYMDGAASYEIPNCMAESPLFVKDGVAMIVLGMTKVNSALNLMAVLSDSRFDFSDAYILSTGCAGSAVGSTVMGDVFVITAAVDYDLGHHADNRDMTDQTLTTWFHDPDNDEQAVFKLNPDLMDRVYMLVRDIPLETTELTRKFMKNAFESAEWATRDPVVLRGTTVTGDNYWKGQYDHENALLMVETYDCPDPFVASDMEDIAVCAAAEQMGMLDRLIILRDSVNMVVYMLGATPESLWTEDDESVEIATDIDEESADIFPTAMKNNFVVGRVIIDAILEGSLRAAE